MAKHFRIDEDLEMTVTDTGSVILVKEVADQSLALTETQFRDIINCSGYHAWASGKLGEKQ